MLQGASGMTNRKPTPVFTGGDLKTSKSNQQVLLFACRAAVLLTLSLGLLALSSIWSYQVGQLKQITAAYEMMYKNSENQLKEKEAQLNKHTSYEVIFEKAKSLGFIGISNQFDKLVIADENFDQKWLAEYKKKKQNSVKDESDKLAVKEYTKKIQLQ